MAFFVLRQDLKTFEDDLKVLINLLITSQVYEPLTGFCCYCLFVVCVLFCLIFFFLLLLNGRL